MVVLIVNMVMKNRYGVGILHVVHMRLSLPPQVISVHPFLIPLLNIFQMIVPLTIIVTDVNDISPQCPNSPTVFMVAEANTLEVRIGQITATDGDSGTNALVNYRISGGDIGGQFRIATTTVSIKSNHLNCHQLMLTH